MRVRRYSDPGRSVINVGLACVWTHLVVQGAYAAYGFTVIVGTEVATRTDALIEWASNLI